MPQIQNTRGISYAGAWLKYGFHEDGFTSGLRAAQSLGGVNLPFEVRLPDRPVDALWTVNVFESLELVRRLLSTAIFGFLFLFGIGVK